VAEKTAAVIGSSFCPEEREENEAIAERFPFTWDFERQNIGEESARMREDSMTWRPPLYQNWSTILIVVS
jgi:hypothetical protein